MNTEELWNLSNATRVAYRKVIGEVKDLLVFTQKSVQRRPG